MFARVVLSLLSIDCFSVQAMSLFLYNIAIFFLDFLFSIRKIILWRTNENVNTLVLVLKWNQACNVPKLLWFYNFSFIPKLKSYFMERILNIYVSFCKHIFRNCLPLYMYSSTVHTMYTLYSVQCICTAVQYKLCIHCTVYM